MCLENENCLKFSFFSVIVGILLYCGVIAVIMTATKYLQYVR
jgi:hypothetical protein